MNKLLSFLLLTFVCTSLHAQCFVCDKLGEDIDIWNAHIINNNYVKWSKNILQNNAFQQNVDGSFEYVYIINSTDSVDVEVLRNITFNYISFYFNIDNSTRANMEVNSPKNGVIFYGKIARIGEYGINKNLNVGEYNQINGDIVFDIRFKSDKIRLSIKIQDYHVLKYFKGVLVENYTTVVRDCFPINPNSRHKQSFAMAFVNANSKCLNYAKEYLEYLNNNVKESLRMNLEDW